MPRKTREVTIEPATIPIGPGNPPTRTKSTRQKSARAKITRAQAIKLFCEECNGYNKHFVRKCKNESCPLWSYRNGYGFEDTDVPIYKPKTYPKDKLATEDYPEDDR